MSTGQNLQASSGSSSVAQFAAAASLVNAAAQYLPPFYGAVASLTALAGALIAGLAPPTGTTGTGEQRVAGSLRLSFTGDAANVAGQLVTAQVYRRPRASGVFAAVGTATAGVATTAGQKETEIRFASPVVFEPGDEMAVVITPSALLTAVLTNVCAAVGSEA